VKIVEGSMEKEEPIKAIGLTEGIQETETTRAVRADLQCEETIEELTEEDSEGVIEMTSKWIDPEEHTEETMVGKEANPEEHSEVIVVVTESHSKEKEVDIEEHTEVIEEDLEEIEVTTTQEEVAKEDTMIEWNG
jgi:hypothetical protein